MHYNLIGVQFTCIIISLWNEHYLEKCGDEQHYEDEDKITLCFWNLSKTLSLFEVTSREGKFVEPL